MVEYLPEVHRIGRFFDKFEVWYVPRLDNRYAGHLARIVSSRAPTQPDVTIKKLSKPSVKSAELPSKAIGQDLMVIDKPE
jgi:hypothetical protein